MRLLLKDVARLAVLGFMPIGALAGDILSSSSFKNCDDGATVKVNNADISFDRTSRNITFSVSGTSTKEQKVKAALVVTAYGIKVYENSFNPCDDSTKVDQLCPVPEGTFNAKGDQVVPEEFMSKIPGIAFSIPDLDGEATLKLTSVDGNQQVGCVNTGITNGRTLEAPAIGYLAGGIAGAALVLSGLSALVGGGGVGTHAPSVGFMTIFTWFQTCATTGMLSVDYPPVYRSFSKNFGFSTGLISWDDMQRSIDNFRKNTGGNLTENSVDFLRTANLTFSAETDSKVKRAMNLFTRQSIETSQGDSAQNASESQTSIEHTVSGITAFAEELKIPPSNTFMTVLLVFAIVVAAITVGILLLKVILEAWAMFGTFPKRLTSFRKRYWRLLAKTLTNLILLLYGIWTTWCVYQFTNGDSWAAKVLAAVTFAIFTAVLLFFTVKIVMVARKYKKAEGDANALYENKEMWIKYSLFYDSYKKSKWWIFMPIIIFMFARGFTLATAANHGLAQTAAQLIIEAVMFIFLLWNRPFATKAGNWINICIQVVRVLSIVCVLVFVEQLGIAKTTQTITGVILIAVQALLSVVLAVLIAVNAIIICCKENPHRRRRKEAEKLNRDLDTLTPLDARNSLLLGPMDRNSANDSYQTGTVNTRKSYVPVHNPAHESSENLVSGAAPVTHGRSRSRSSSRSAEFDMYQRQPTVPNMGGLPSYNDRRVL